MTKNLEETFNLPPLKEVLNHTPRDALADAAAKNGHDPDNSDIIEVNAKLTDTFALADKIDNALPEVTGMESLDRDMDAYALKAMETFDTLIDLGHNMEDRHAANVFDVASKMMKNAIEAKDKIYGNIINSNFIDIGDKESYDNIYEKYLSELGKIG